MAAKIPDKLKTADIQRFATRAAQLEKFKPIVTYWCEYYILQQVLGKGLHSADEECTAYATHLMDKLEQTKSDNVGNDAILDDVAAKAYMENFALETFERADKTQREDRVNRQTADTFQAAATFLDVLAIWGALDQEQSAKSKFAKFHALRIARALKAGEDPNATNPKIEEPQQQSAMDEEGIDAEMRDLENATRRKASTGSVYLQPTVESAPDSKMPSRSPSTGPGIAFDPPQVPTLPPGASAPQSEEHGDVSPIDAPEDDINSRQGSVGGGYFPSLPDAPPTAPTAPPTAPSPGEFYQAAHAPLAPTPPFALERPSNPTPSARRPSSMLASPFAQPPPPPPPLVPPQHAPAQMGYTQPPWITAPAPAPAPAPISAVPLASYRTDDEAVMQAQKHAKWAISALNFEDVPTAVRELQLALQSLGAR